MHDQYTSGGDPVQLKSAPAGPPDKGVQPPLSNSFRTDRNRLYLMDALHYCSRQSDIDYMEGNTAAKKARRCAYIRACYLAEELKCFGYKADCPLYQKSNGQYYNARRFHEAMDRLIDKTRAKYENLPT